MIPQWMLDLPRHGNINLHASLLPKYRGAAPIQWAIARGESVTGVTTMRIDSGLDTGDILLQKEVPIAPQDTAETLAPRLAAVGCRPDGRNSARLASRRTCIRVRRTMPRPLSLPFSRRKMAGSIFIAPPKRFAIVCAAFSPGRARSRHFAARTCRCGRLSRHRGETAPGELAVQGDRLFVGSGESTALELLEVQPEGKKRMPARDFVHGYHPTTGEKLG